MLRDAVRLHRSYMSNISQCASSSRACIRPTSSANAVGMLPSTSSHVKERRTTSPSFIKVDRRPRRMCTYPLAGPCIGTGGQLDALEVPRRGYVV